MLTFFSCFIVLKCKTHLHPSAKNTSNKCCYVGSDKRTIGEKVGVQVLSVAHSFIFSYTYCCSFDFVQSVKKMQLSMMIHTFKVIYLFLILLYFCGKITFRMSKILDRFSFYFPKRCWWQEDSFNLKIGMKMKDVYNIQSPNYPQKYPKERL